MISYYEVEYLDPITEEVKTKTGLPILTMPNAEKAMGEFEFMLRTYGTDILFFKSDWGKIYLIPKKNIISIKYEPSPMPGE